MLVATFTEAAKASRVKTFRDLIKMLPRSNRETLEELIMHLSKYVPGHVHEYIYELYMTVHLYARTSMLFIITLSSQFLWCNFTLRLRLKNNAVKLFVCEHS